MNTLFVFVTICASLISCIISTDAPIDKNDMQKCISPIQQYLYCLKQEVRYHYHIIGGEISPSFKTKVDACLHKLHCRTPSQGTTIESKFKSAELTVWLEFRRWIELLPTPKRQCLVDATGDSYREVFTQCLKKFSDGLTVPPLSDVVGLPADVLLLLNQRAYYRTEVSDAFHDCNQTEKAAACVLGLRRTEFPQACTIRKHCAVIDDDAGFNDCFTTCVTLSPTCKGIVNQMRSHMCSCQLDRRSQLLKTGQSHVTETPAFQAKAKSIAAALLTELPSNNTMISKFLSCGLPLPIFKSPVSISYPLARYVLLYIFGYTSRDITFCQNCPGQEL